MAANWRRSFGLDSIDLLVCDICLEQYNDSNRQPKFLSCHHSFCESCLNQVATESRTLECPACRQVMQLPAGGVKELQTNFYMTHMRDVLNKLGANKVHGCPQHSNQPTSFFCQKCMVAICRDCMVLDHKEAEGHEIQDVKLAEVEQREMLTNEMESGRAIIQTVQAHLHTLQSELANLSIAKETAMLDIEKAFTGYAKMLDLRKSDLCSKVEEIYDERQDVIVQKSDYFNHTTKHLSTMLSHGDKIHDKGTLADVVGARKTVSSTNDALKASAGNMSIGENYLAFDSKAGLEEFQMGIGQLATVFSNGFLPSRIHYEPKDMIAALPSRVSMQVFGYGGQRLKGYPIEVEIFDPTGAQIHAETTKNEDSDETYDICFHPQMSGNHRFVALFLGKKIKGAEISLPVKSNNPILKIGALGNGEGKFRCPRAVARDKHGRIYVADTGNKLIQKLDKDGNYLHQFQISGGSEDCSTCDLALNVEKNEIVCTETMVGTSVNPTMGNTVAIYNTEGTLKHKFTNKVMKCALCVATNRHSEIIISDYLVHSLFMYDGNGSFIRRIGNSNAFNHPAFICAGANDTIIVSDTNNDVVQIFDRQGNFLDQFGQSGSGKGELKQPFGVGQDGENILVVDSGNRRIQVFRNDGTFVSMIESADDPLNQPRGLVVTEDGHVLVADRDSNCIKKFRYK